MTAASDYLENRFLNDYLITSKPWIALFTADPGDAGTTGSEASGGTYARKQGTFTVANGTATLADDLVWSGMPAMNVNGVAFFDAATGGNLLFHGALTASKTVAAGDAFAFPAGNLSIAID